MRDLQILWDYHHMNHDIRPTDIGIGLGSHDIGVAQFTASLFLRGMFPLIVFTGANAPTTLEIFPRGEAIHYHEEAVRIGVPSRNILLETQATNTGQNIQLSRKLLAEREIKISSVTLISRPYQQRRAYATCRKLWPDVDVICASQKMTLDEYIQSIGDFERVATMMVGDTQRIDRYAHLGFAIVQEMPTGVVEAFDRLVSAGYTGRLI
ncbi:YdcF family protein [Nonomuraea sp. NBC_01738]|uniref:YdcF family protein n=1 Tax=Nonomuraea sp. NBC_01738 TaxID=2976003 RepID=UPI002E0ED3D4|nr:YdcF family protein [Nonomuraea sp. NBC_01738]